MNEPASDEKQQNNQIPTWALNMDRRHFGQMLLYCQYEHSLSSRLRAAKPYAFAAIGFSLLGFSTPFLFGGAVHLFHWVGFGMTLLLLGWLALHRLAIASCRFNLRKLVLGNQLLPEKRPELHALEVSESKEGTPMSMLETRLRDWFIPVGGLKRKT